MDNPGDANKMSFFDHLEVLRWHLIRGIIAWGITTVVFLVIVPMYFDAIVFGPISPDFLTFQWGCQISEWLQMDILCPGPESFTDYEFINISLTGQFMSYLKVSLILGVVAAFPYMFWELWKFIRPGLRNKEIKLSRMVIFYCSFLFAFGVVFGYFMLTPFSAMFFTNFNISDVISNEFDFIGYMGIMTMIVMGCGIMFELPIFIWFLSKLGIVTPKGMRKYRKHSLVVILIISALITPADFATQIIIAIPVYILYEISIFISAKVERDRLKKEKEESLT